MTSSVDKLTIETPEQTALEYQLAGVGSRFLALALDTLIQFVAGLAVYVTALLVVLGTIEWFSSLGQWAIAAITIVSFVLYYGYYAVFEAMWNGQTPGKRFAGIRVIKDSGRPITPVEAIGRNLLRIVDQLPGIYAVGILTALINSRNKRLGDLVAGTVVVHEAKFTEVRPAWVAASAPAGAPRRYGAEKLSAEEFQLIETFLHRRDTLEQGVRYQSAVRIAERIARTLGASRDEIMRPEEFLQAVADERRSVARFL
ncbi:MAG TPA: RDD family protein [Candidatus Acidoferrales bacterium]